MRTKGRRRPIAADPIAAADTVGTFAWIGIFQDLFDLEGQKKVFLLQALACKRLNEQGCPLGGGAAFDCDLSFMPFAL